MAARAFARRPMFASLPGESAMAIATKFMKRRFRRLRQIPTGPSMTIETAAGARLVDEVVVTSDATNGSVILVWEIRAQRGGYRLGLEQAQAPDGGGQKQ